MWVEISRVLVIHFIITVFNHVNSTFRTTLNNKLCGHSVNDRCFQCGRLDRCGKSGGRFGGQWSRFDRFVYGAVSWKNLLS